MATLSAGPGNRSRSKLSGRVRGQDSAKDKVLPSRSRHVEPRKSQRFGTGSDTRNPAESERHARRHRYARHEVRQLPPLPFTMIGTDLAWFTQAEAPHRHGSSGSSQRQQENATGLNAAIAASGAMARDEADLPGARIDDGKLAKGDSVYVSAQFVMFCCPLLRHLVHAGAAGWQMGARHCRHGMGILPQA